GIQYSKKGPKNVVSIKLERLVSLLKTIYILQLEKPLDKVVSVQGFLGVENEMLGQII
ncbi:hypothetical protein DFH28DRAFT_858478, partial [Melampsora americana]